jgi:hypothetical protein
MLRYDSLHMREIIAIVMFRQSLWGPPHSSKRTTPSVVEKHGGGISGTDAIAVHMKEKHVIAEAVRIIQTQDQQST